MPRKVRNRYIDQAIFEGITAAAGIEKAKDYTGKEGEVVQLASNGLSAIFEYVPQISEGDFLTMMAEVYRASNR